MDDCVRVPVVPQVEALGDEPMQCRRLCAALPEHADDLAILRLHKGTEIFVERGLPLQRKQLSEADDPREHVLRLDILVSALTGN